VEYKLQKRLTGVNAIMKYILAWTLCVAQLLIFGCAMRTARATNQQKAELLALERGRLLDTNDPVIKTKSYIVISGILLDFAEVDICEGAFDVLPKRLDQYVEAITAARDTWTNSDIEAQRSSRGLREFENALSGHIGRLGAMAGAVAAERRDALDKATATATAIRTQIVQRLSPAGV
jgi:hypothetical protein